MSELKNILSEFARALKVDSEAITCDDGDTGAFIPKGSIDSTLSEFYFRIDKGEFDDIHLNKAKAEAVRDAAYKNRKAIVEGGDMWLCAVDDLVEYANKLESQAKNYKQY